MTFAATMKKMPYIIMIMLLLFSGCSRTDAGEDLVYKTYTDIPGVTAEEIAAIDALRAKKPRLTYGFCISTEAFLNKDGELGGFAALFCNKMTELLGFEFDYYMYNWEELNEKLLSKEIDLVGDLTPTPERKEKYLMTDPIVHRMIKIFTDTNADSLSGIAKNRPVKCAFMDGGSTYSLIEKSWDLPFEPVFIDDHTKVPDMLISGEIDAFIEEGTLEAEYASRSFVEVEDYYPLTYSPISLTTGNDELAPIISVMEKYLIAGGSYELTKLYNEGYKAYLRDRLFSSLTDEEKQYINAHSTKETAVAAAYEADSYPSSFYNKKEGEFQGIAIDTLSEIAELTGLHFAAANPTNSTRSDLIRQLGSKEYAFISTLVRTDSSEDKYLWPDHPYDSSQYALISRNNYPDADINQVLFSKVGLISGTAFEESFHNWFPNSTNMVVYSSNAEAIAALENGEIDLLMASMNVLLHITNYLEKADFKANIVFDYSADSYFAFNSDEAILCSIVNKAQHYVDVAGISGGWKRRLFNYDGRIFKSILPYSILSIIVLAAGLTTIIVFYLKNRRINRHLGDIVESRTSELAMKESLLTAIFASIPDLIFTKDTDSNLLSCNKSFERHFGVKEADLVGKNEVDGLNLPEELANEYREADREVMRTGKMITIEEIKPSVDGAETWLETVKMPLMKGSDVLGIVCISRDITERKLAEETLKLTLDNLNTCIYISEIDTDKILFINEKMADEFGGKAEDFIGKTCWKVLQDNFTERCEFCPIPKLQESGDDYYVWEEHNTVTGKHYKNMDTLVKWPDGRLVHMQHSVDVTDSVRLQQDLEHASRAKSDFLSRMSHEMRTPLSAIIGMNNIAMNTEDMSKIRHCHDRINGASRSLLGIINDILDMSKIEADKFELSCNEFDIDKMLMNITNIINQRAEEKHQELVVSLNQNVPMFVYGDEMRLSQVITNLLSNAVKFTPEGGTIVVSVNNIAENGDEVTLRIEVADDGIGITEEQRQRLFTSFEQADSSISRRFGGTGLGLAISKRIVELMGGEIWVESEYGKGSVFIFTIKVKKAKKKLSSMLRADININNINILAVDDCRETLDYFAHVMETHNLPFDVARSGDEALKKIEERTDKPFNMFFVDWKMPGMDGIELSRRIKGITGDNSVIFMISVADWNTMEKEATEAGVDQFITKPLFASTLINSINDCLAVDSPVAGNTHQALAGLHKYPGHAILIAEDIEINREIMSAVFEDTGVSIDYAENGLEAVSMFKKSPEKYSLILMDIHMPEMDGFEATRTIRALNLEQARTVPIVAMTANVFREDIENCLASGMNDHIGKPVEPNDLFAKLDKYLARL